MNVSMFDEMAGSLCHYMRRSVFRITVVYEGNRWTSVFSLPIESAGYKWTPTFWCNGDWSSVYSNKSVHNYDIYRNSSKVSETSMVFFRNSWFLADVAITASKPSWHSHDSLRNSTILYSLEISPGTTPFWRQCFRYYEERIWDNPTSHKGVLGGNMPQCTLANYTIMGEM